MNAMHSANGLKAISRCKGVSILGGYVALTYLFEEGSNAGRFRPIKSLLSTWASWSLFYNSRPNGSTSEIRSTPQRDQKRDDC